MTAAAMGEARKLSTFEIQLAERLGTSDPNEQIKAIDSLIRQPITAVVRFDPKSGQAVVACMDTEDLSVLEIAMLSGLGSIRAGQEEQRRKLEAQVAALQEEKMAEKKAEEKPRAQRGKKQ